MEHLVWTGHNLNNVRVGGLNGNKSNILQKVRKDKIGNEWCVVVLTVSLKPLSQILEVKKHNSNCNCNYFVGDCRQHVEWLFSIPCIEYSG